MKLKLLEKIAPDPDKPDKYKVKWLSDDGLKLKLSKT